MPNAFAEAMHHQTLRTYRRELEFQGQGLKRVRLLTLIARLNIEATERGWPPTEDSKWHPQRAD